MAPTLLADCSSQTYLASLQGECLCDAATQVFVLLRVCTIRISSAAGQGSIIGCL